MVCWKGHRAKLTVVVVVAAAGVVAVAAWVLGEAVASIVVVAGAVVPRAVAAVVAGSVACMRHTASLSQCLLLDECKGPLRP